MRVLIFPTDTGEGHNCASKAVKEHLDAEGVDTMIIDVLDTDGQKSDVVSKLYEGTVNHVPGLFGALYGFAEHISSNKRHSPIYYLNTLYGKSLLKVINELRPQVIVCPHMFSAHAVTRLIEKYDLDIPTVGIITDYTCSPFWEETLLNRYVVAHQVVADECVSKGMDKDKLIPLGIPVSSKFKVRLTKEEARTVFGIQKEKVFAIMGGSMGYGKIPELAAELVRRVPDAQVLAVCGRNELVYKKTKEIRGVTALRYIDNIDTVMDAADVLLTKPGGLSTTEAMTKRIPLVITLPIPGGEVRNSAVITKLGMAVSATTMKDAADAACALLMDQIAQDKMIAAQKKNCSQSAAEDTSKLIIEMGSYGEVRLCSCV
ncbi:MAG: hypothetical protein FWC47_09920 [Oscillospiraceae bacterium]|nr:hypothetical protein [Oscillospiraceae bacterium]